MQLDVKTMLRRKEYRQAWNAKPLNSSPKPIIHSTQCFHDRLQARVDERDDMQLTTENTKMALKHDARPSSHARPVLHLDVS